MSAIGEVQSLGPRRRNDVRGIACEEEPPVLHRLDHEAAHARHALLEDRALGERPALDAEAALELGPDPVVRPLVEVLVRLALEVQAAEARGPQAEQREPALVVRIDELLARGRDVGEDAEPAEGVVARERAQDAARDARAADAVEAVAAGDHVALELAPLAIVGEADPRPLGLELVHADVVDLEEQRQPALQPRGDQVLDDLRLSVDHDRAPAGELAERDPVALAVELELDPVVDDAFALQPVGDARLRQQLDGALLEDARPDPVLDVVAAAVLEHDRLDPRALEQPRERQPRRAGADDSHLRAGRGHPPSSSKTCCAIAKAPFAAGTPQ